ncbi:MAG: radical SAM protein [Elusimicrobiota bacterium]
MLQTIKTLYRRLLPADSRERISYAREWGALLFNYALMRSPLLNRLRCVSVWPHALYIEGTNICNARCVFCVYPEMKRAKSTMPMELFRKVVDEAVALGISEVDLTPIVGDPFVDAHLFERLDFLASKPSLRRFHFYTNSIAMKPKLAGRLVAYGERLWVFCSFGGFDRETYRSIMGVDGFADAAAHIRALIEEKSRTGSKVRIGISLRIPDGNASGDFWEYLCARRDEGLIVVSGVRMFDNWGGMLPDGRLAEAGLVPKPLRRPGGACRRLLTGPVVLADGRVNACCCRDVEATLIIGDTKEESLGEILSGGRLKGLLSRFAAGELPEICRRCTKYQSVFDGVRDTD